MTLSLAGNGTPTELSLGLTSNTYSMSVRRTDDKSGLGEATLSFVSPIPSSTMVRIADDGAVVAILRQGERLPGRNQLTFTVSVLAPTLEPLRTWTLSFRPQSIDAKQLDAAWTIFRNHLKEAGLAPTASQLEWASVAFQAPGQARPVSALGSLFGNKLWLKLNDAGGGQASALWQQLDLDNGNCTFVLAPYNVLPVGVSLSSTLALVHEPSGRASIVAYQLEVKERHR